MADNKIQLIIDILTKGQKELKEVKKDTEQLDQNFGKSGKSSGKLKTGLGKITGGFKQLKLAIISSGIGALAIALLAIGKAFVSNEAGQNKFKKFMNALGVITGNLTDLLAKLGNKIIKVFEDPKKALEDFKDAIKKNIEVRINSTIEMFGLLGSTIKKVFKGDFKGAAADAEAAALKFIDSQTGVEDSVNKAANAIKGFVEETKKEITESNRLSDLQADIDKQERELTVSRVKREAEISALRVKTLDEENQTVEERKQFLIEAQKINNSIFADEEELARGRLEIQRERNKMSGSTKDDLKAEADLEADLIRLNKQRDDANRRMFSQQQTLQKQAVAEKQKEIDAELKLQEEKEKIRQKELEEEQKRLEGLEALRADFDKRGELLNLTTFERQLQAIDEFYLTKQNELIEAGLTEEEITLQSEQAKDRVRLQFAQRTASGLSGMFSNLGKIMKSQGKSGFEAWKKMAQAQALVDTYKAANSAYASLAGVPVIGPVLGAVAAGAAIAAGLVNVKAIEKQKFATGGIVTSETEAIIGEAGPEAVVPLPDGKSIPVKGVGGSNKIMGSILAELKALNLNIVKQSKKITFVIETTDPETTVRNLSETEDRMNGANDAL